MLWHWKVTLWPGVTVWSRGPVTSWGGTAAARGEKRACPAALPAPTGAPSGTPPLPCTVRVPDASDLPTLLSATQV